MEEGMEKDKDKKVIIGGDSYAWTGKLERA